MNAALILVLVAQLVSTVVGLTPAPTTGITPWLVGSGTAVVDGDNIFDGSLQVSHPIGSLVDTAISESVIVELLDPTCASNLTMTGNVVEISTSGYSGSPFVYDISVDQSLIASDPTFVFFDTTDPVTGDSVGSIKFCTRVSTIEGPIQVAFRETIFELGFDLTDNAFNLTSISIDENTPDSFETLVEDDFGVDICQCDSSYTCVQSPPPVGQDTALQLCLYPTDASNASTNTFVHIANFNLQLSAGDFTYNPISFGSATWETDSLTKVSASGDILQIITQIVAQFFIRGFTSLAATGNCFLEFDGSKADQLPLFAGYGLDIALMEEVSVGCLQKLIDNLRGMFKAGADNASEIVGTLSNTISESIPNMGDMQLPSVTAPSVPDISVQDLVPDQLPEVQVPQLPFGKKDFLP